MKRAGRRWVNALAVICFLCLAFTLATALYTYRYEADRYRASYTFFALPRGTRAEEESPLQAALMLAGDCNALLQTKPFQQKVLATVPSDGATFVTASSVDATHLIRVDATGPDAAVALGLANAAGKALLREAEATLLADGVREVSQAELPQSPCAPNRPLKIAAAALASFAALSLLGMLLGSSRKPFCWKPAAVKRLSARCLAAVADHAADTRSFAKRNLSRAEGAILYDYVDRLVHENVRDAALALRAIQERAGYSVLTTGMNQSAGNAPFTLLLATELALQGFDVLLMEMDAYAPALRGLLGVCGSRDALDCLRDETALREAILPTAVPRLCFMDVCHEAGFVPSIAATSAFASFLSDAAQSFDYVLLCAPPVEPLCDAPMLAAVVDVALLTVADGRNTASEIEDRAAELQSVARRFGGFVLTGVPRRRFHLDAGDKRALRGLGK